MSEGSRLWRKHYNKVKNVNLVANSLDDVRKNKLDKYVEKQRKRITKVDLMTLGKYVYVTYDSKFLKTCVRNSIGVSNLEEKIPYLGERGYIIKSDHECELSKICFSDNQRIWFPIKALSLEEQVKDSDIKILDNKETLDNVKNKQKKFVKYLPPIQNTSKNLSFKDRSRMVMNQLDRNRMNLAELSLMHSEKNNSYIEKKVDFFKKLDKIKKNVVIDKININ